VRFTRDWIPGSVHAPFFLAPYKGHYKVEGLDVAIDRGKGSAAVVRQLGSGVYDLATPTSAWSWISTATTPGGPFPS
jgi:NitT/TauT family transport system substrate-binding protein